MILLKIDFVQKSINLFISFVFSLRGDFYMALKKVDIFVFSWFFLSKSFKKCVFWTLKSQFERKRAERRNSDRAGPKLYGTGLDFVQLLILCEIQQNRENDPKCDNYPGRRIPQGFLKESMRNPVGFVMWTHFSQNGDEIVWQVYFRDF